MKFKHAWMFVSVKSKWGILLQTKTSYILDTCFFWERLVSLTIEEFDQAQEVLDCSEQETGGVGLHCNARKSELKIFSNMFVEIKVKNGKKWNLIQ